MHGQVELMHGQEGDVVGRGDGKPTVFVQFLQGIHPQARREPHDHSTSLFQERRSALRDVTI